LSWRGEFCSASVEERAGTGASSLWRVEFCSTSIIVSFFYKMTRK
jgi:hypothetical protein